MNGRTLNKRLKRTLLACLALFLLGSMLQTAMASGLQSHVNARKIALGDTLELTLTTDSSAAATMPDLQPLQKDFEILGTGQSSQINIINGRRSESFSWVITLAPTSKGQLTIPAIYAGNASSEPLSIEVVDAADLPAGSTAAGQLSIEVTADPGAHYVQEAIPVTVRIQSDSAILQAQLDEPSGENFLLSQTGEDQVSRNGHEGTVIERHYVLKPQKSGKVILPPLTLQATVEDPASRGSSLFSNLGFSSNKFFMPSGSSLFADMFNTGREVVVRSRPLELEVKPRPTGDQVWFLPAKRVELSEDWSPAQPDFRVGEAVVRKISLFALGASGEQLPDIPIVKTVGARQYLDRSSERTADTRDGTASIREFEVSVVPTRSGEVTLPAIDVRWWDTVADKERVASLPAHTIHVLPGTGLNATDNPAPTSAAANGNSLKEVSNSPETAPVESPGFLDNHGVIKASLLTLAAAIVLIGSTLILLKRQWTRRTGNQKVDAGNRVAPRPVSSDASEIEQRERAFVQACKSNDLRGAYSALNAWLWLLAKSGHKTSTSLAAEAAEMEKQLFADRGDTTWSGRKVLEVFNKEQQSRRRSDRHPPGRKSIPTLYPT